MSLSSNEARETPGSVLAERWVWFIDVVFGAVTGLALDKFEPVVRAAAARSVADLFMEIVVGLCLVLFLVYDVAALHLFVRRYPYHVSSVGYSRFVLDVCMAFVLFVFITSAIDAGPERKVYATVVSLTIWHSLALLWHWLARLEGGGPGPLRRSVLPHILFIALYWSVPLGWHFFCNTLMGWNLPVRSRVPLLILCGTFGGVAVYRWYQVTKLYAPAPVLTAGEESFVGGAGRNDAASTAAQEKKTVGVHGTEVARPVLPVPERV
jgi:hypothetical protein